MLLAKKEKNPLYGFLDIKKAYDSINKNSTLKLLAMYGMGRYICNLIKNMWRDEVIISKQQIYHWGPFKAEWGVRQRTKRDSFFNYFYKKHNSQIE